MNDVSQAEQTVYPTLQWLAPEEALCHVPLRVDDAARSARNIALWTSYLPTECVRTMIRMGWDYTT